MAAQYPSNPRSFTPRVDRVDVNTAQDINDLQQEVTATQVVVGRNPHVSGRYPSASSVGDRVTQFEDDALPRLATLEARMRRAAVTARRSATIQYNSSTAWQNLVMPDTVASLNDFGTALQLYDGALGRFYSVAPSPGIWTLSATVVFEPPVGTAVGVRGLAIVTQAGSVLAMQQVAPAQGVDTALNVSWTGRLPVDPAYYLHLAVKQDQGTAINVRGDTAATPCRADFTHTPG